MADKNKARDARPMTLCSAAMPRWVAFVLLAASAHVLGGCGLGWRVGAGLHANTEGSVAGELYAGANMGVGFSDRQALEAGVELDASIRSNPARLGTGLTDRVDFRSESDHEGLGWMVGAYGGVRGLFLDGNLLEDRLGGSFDLLPTLSLSDHTYKHVGIEVQGGVATLDHDPEHEKAPDRAEFAVRLFYEVFTLERGHF